LKGVEATSRVQGKKKPAAFRYEGKRKRNAGNAAQ
jgi:hypothetical protein